MPARARARASPCLTRTTRHAAHILVQEQIRKDNAARASGTRSFANLQRCSNSTHNVKEMNMKTGKQGRVSHGEYWAAKLNNADERFEANRQRMKQTHSESNFERVAKAKARVKKEADRLYDEGQKEHARREQVTKAVKEGLGETFRPTMVMSALGELWRSLEPSERQHWKDVAEADRKRYEKQLGDDEDDEDWTPDGADDACSPVSGQSIPRRRYQGDIGAFSDLIDAGASKRR